MNLLLTLIIAGVIFIFAFILFLASDLDMDWRPDKIDKIVFWTSGVVMAICSILIIFSFIMLLLMPGEDFTTKVTGTSSIVALNDGSLIEGRSGFLRSSYIEEELYYFYMKDVGNGSYAMRKVPADRTFIYYTDDNFRIETIERTYNLGCFYYPEDNIYYIYVPKGTITEEFTIDLNY